MVLITLILPFTFLIVGLVTEKQNLVNETQMLNLIILFSHSFDK